MNDKPYNVLILCTGNSCRSIMAEALFNTLGKGRYIAYSAGSHPSGSVNPFAIEQIVSTDYPVVNLRSKSWDEYAKPDAPKMDFVITVCDNAAGEVCPVWPGQPISAHWGFEDPVRITGTDEQKREEFKKIFHQIRMRIQIFMQLPIEKLDRFAIKREMENIGKT